MFQNKWYSGNFIFNFNFVENCMTNFIKKKLMIGWVSFNLYFKTTIKEKKSVFINCWAFNQNILPLLSMHGFLYMDVLLSLIPSLVLQTFVTQINLTDS